LGCVDEVVRVDMYSCICASVDKTKLKGKKHVMATLSYSLANDTAVTFLAIKHPHQQHTFVKLYEYINWIEFVCEGSMIAYPPCNSQQFCRSSIVDQPASRSV
jgi:hypothetical protein